MLKNFKTLKLGRCWRFCLEHSHHSSKSPNVLIINVIVNEIAVESIEIICVCPRRSLRFCNDSRALFHRLIFEMRIISLCHIHQALDSGTSTIHSPQCNVCDHPGISALFPQISITGFKMIYFCRLGSWIGHFGYWPFPTSHQLTWPANSSDWSWKLVTDHVRHVLIWLANYKLTLWKLQIFTFSKTVCIFTFQPSEVTQSMSASPRSERANTRKGQWLQKTKHM